MPTKKPAPAKRPVLLPSPRALARTRADRAATAWLEGYNPLRGLTLRRAQSIFDAARRGNDVRLQWIYENIEQADPTLMVCAERRAAALADLDWTIRPKAAGRARGFDETLAREQCALLEHAYGDAEEVNLLPALEHLAKAFFRGHAHARPLWSADGLTLRGFETFNAWNLCRDLETGRWHWNPAASETLDFAALEPVPPGELVTLVRTRHIDYPALAIYLRNGLGEREWGRFLERYGIPPVLITMPQDIDPAQVDAFCARAVEMADGGSGALPFGSVVTYAQEARGVNPFREFLDHQQQLVVLMATGGMLTSLTGATGIGQGATQAHEETWRAIVRRDAAAIATALNRTVTDALLDRAFPGRPHLAAFDFQTRPEPGPAELFDLAAKAVQAGYRVAQDELEERTGFRLEPNGQGLGEGLSGAFGGGFGEGLAQPPAPAGAQGAPPRPAPFGAGSPAAAGHLPLTTYQLPFTDYHLPISNRAPAADGGLGALAGALRADCAPLAEALQSLLDHAQQSEGAEGQRPSDSNHLPFTTDHLRREAAALAARLPDLLPDDPEMAAAIEEALTRTFGAALATAPEKPAVANREGECHAKDPANCPYHGTGRFAGKDGKPAEGKAKSAPKELPPRPNAKASAADYRKANLTRGEAALGNILADHADVPAAMVSRKLGPIDFVWGREGNPGRDYEGGYGFSHIIAKHGEEAAQKVPKILAFGKYFHDEQERDAYTVVLGNEVVSVKRETGNFLVVTSYASDKKATAYLRRGGQIENKAKDDSATF